MIKEFSTENGIIVPAVTAEQMKEIDRISIEETGPNLFQMMENAGRNLSELTIKIMGDGWEDKNIVVLAGHGGNGGGGICAARHLANRGYKVKVCIAKPNKLNFVPKYQLHILKSTNAKIISVKDLHSEKPDLIIDAIIGYNLSGEPKGSVLKLIKWAESKLSIKISLDVPSGIDATTGIAACNHIKPDLTLTLALPKTGLLPELTGELYLGDIGIPQAVYNKLGINSEIIFKKSFVERISILNN